MLPKTKARDIAGGNAWRWPETAAMLGYLLLLGIGLHWHEPWADEAQAWLMARDMSWGAMVLHGVRYEGSPALWHTLLWVPARLHAGFTAARWMGGAIAACGMAVLLRYAPFPRLLRLLLPFTFFLLYQQGVIARSYVLLPVLLFGAAALLRRARPPVLAVAGLLALLANVSVHGFVLSLGLGAVAVAGWRRAGMGWRQCAPGLLVLAAAWTLAVATTFPPRDIAFPAGRNISRSWVKARGEAALPPEAVRPGELAPFQPPPVHRAPGEGTRRRLLRVLALVTYPLSTGRVLGLAAAGALLTMALRRGRAPGEFGLLGLLPYGLMLAVFQALYMAPRHAGTLVLAFLVSAWLCWPRDDLKNKGAAALAALLLLVCAQQIGWTARVLWLDVHGPYAANPMTAAFLRGKGVGAAGGPTVAGFYYHSIGVLPYFGRNIYENQGGHSYWVWSTENRSDARAPFALAQRPDYAVVSGWTWGDNAGITVDWAQPEEQAQPAVPLADVYGIRRYFLAHGYRETHRFCGKTWMRDGYSEELCDVVLEPR